jgi:CheY-like chemotaxis protein
MDVQMPGMNGLEATVAIRAAEGGTEHPIPIVALTARADRADRELCLEAGMNGYVTKPIRADELLAAIDLAVAPLPVEETQEFALPPATDLFDCSTALLAVNGDRKLLLRVAAAALREAPVMMSELDAAVAGGGSEAVHHAAHRLKGAIALFGTSRLADPLEELEESARRGDVEDAESLSSELRGTVEAVLGGVRDLLARGEAPASLGASTAADSRTVVP